MNTYAIHIVSEKESWLHPYLVTLKRDLEKRRHSVFWVHSVREVGRGEMAFYLGFGVVVPPEVLKRNRHNLVVHESELPRGKGWSPLTWQILEGKNKIPILLFEAKERVDSGPVYLRREIVLRGTELVSELRDAQAKATLELCLEFVAKYPAVLKEARLQKGRSSYYQKRTVRESALDPDKTIREQFNLLRVVDNEKYPAYFELHGKRYLLSIQEDPRDFNDGKNKNK